jgi:hypothetical protein
LRERAAPPARWTLQQDRRGRLHLADLPQPALETSP